jgi:hypothetical protein
MTQRLDRREFVGAAAAAAGMAWGAASCGCGRETGAFGCAGAYGTVSWSDPCSRQRVVEGESK